MDTVMQIQKNQEKRFKYNYLNDVFLFYRK